MSKVVVLKKWRPSRARRLGYTPYDRLERARREARSVADGLDRVAAEYKRGDNLSVSWLAIKASLLHRLTAMFVSDVLERGFAGDYTCGRCHAVAYASARRLPNGWEDVVDRYSDHEEDVYVVCARCANRRRKRAPAKVFKIR